MYIHAQISSNPSDLKEEPNFHMLSVTKELSMGERRKPYSNVIRI